MENRIFPGRRHLVGALVMALLTAHAHAQPPKKPDANTPSVQLKLDGGQSIKPQKIKPDEATYINADRLSTTGQENTLLEGNVEIRRNDIRLLSDSVSYSPLTDRAQANGHVVIEQPGIRLQAPAASMKLGSKETRLESPTFELLSTKGSGRADSAVFDGVDTLTLENPDYTVCKIPSPSQAQQADWYIRADQLELDQGSETGRAHGATVVFKDVPILKTPYLSFPTSERRKSGFLAPSFGTVSNSGAEITIPYYLNIAPDKDLTLYPKLITSRGFQIGTQTRWLTENNQAEVRYDLLANDQKAHTDRYALSVLDTWKSGDYSAGLNINKVSDNQYFVDFSRSQAVASQRVLMQEGYLAHDAGPWRSSLRVVRQQTLQLENDLIVEPYNRLPELNIQLTPTRFGNSFVSASGQFTQFSNPGTSSTRVEGSRAVTRASVFMPFNQSAFSLTPKLSVQATSYNLDNQTTGLKNNPSSVIPTASLDGTVYFDRQATFFGKTVNQTLEPRIFYLYTPYKDQSSQPLFDTSMTDQSLSRIFAENRYSGYDRVGDANQLTLAVSSRFNDLETGEELFSTSLGQRLYLQTPQIALTPQESALSSKSDFFLTARGRLTREITADATSQLNSSSGRQERGSISLGYSPSTGKQLNVGYRYTRTQINQFDVSGQWPLSPRWSAVGRVNYSTLDNRLIEGIAGLEYSPGCWATRVVAQRFSTSPTQQTTSLFIQLELTGLGRLGSNPLDLLTRTITGYTPFGSQSVTHNEP